MIPNSFTHIFDFVKASQGVEFLVRCSYLEIYNEVVKYAIVTVYRSSSTNSNVTHYDMSFNTQRFTGGSQAEGPPEM